MPLVIDLDDPDATAEVAGGKGASLARLARAGFRVPPGFHVTTGAYRSVTDGSVGVLPEPVAAAVTAAYAALGGTQSDVPVAVRSSATTEDRPGTSAAGQHDTFLNVRGTGAVLDAVRRCWASLSSDRAVAYRRAHGAGRGSGEVSMAVVVQAMVPADVAGVLFTVDPVTGAGDRLVLSAGRGPGESLVSGDVTGDLAVIDRAAGELVSYQAAGAPVLSPEQAAEIARTGLEIEKLYGGPVDVEWALADGELFILQARPVTAAGAETWNDSLDGDYLWSNGNLGEAFPEVTTPATWSFIEILMSMLPFPPTVPGYRGYGRIGGRFYVNVSVSVALEALAGISPDRFETLLGPVLGKLPPMDQIPRPELPRWARMRLMLPLMARMATRIVVGTLRMRGFLAAAPDRCDRLRAEIGRAEDPVALARLWPREIRPLIDAACGTLTAATSRNLSLLSVPGTLAALVGEADAVLLLSGQRDAGPGGPGLPDSGLASLGPAIGLARLARGETDRDAYIRAFGHRGAHEVELSAPRPAEDPAWIESQLAAVDGVGRDADALLADREAARAAAWERLRRDDPGKAAKARALVARWSRIARAREAARSECARSAWVTRDWVRRAGELTGHGDGLFFLSLDETYRLLLGDRAPLSRIPARRAAYDAYRALPPYPALIRGRFDPGRWAADPGRRTDRYDERDQASRPAGPVAAGTITGFPGAAGVVEGTARILAAPEEAARLGAGEILVTTVTNIGWTPVFPRAAAVVTDVGAPLSHAAIVARELGVPAVVGCGDATARLRDGDRVRVDGAAGTVEILPLP